MIVRYAQPEVSVVAYSPFSFVHFFGQPPLFLRNLSYRINTPLQSAHADDTEILRGVFLYSTDRVDRNISHHQSDVISPKQMEGHTNIRDCILSGPHAGPQQQLKLETSNHADRKYKAHAILTKFRQTSYILTPKPCVNLIFSSTFSSIFERSISVCP